MSRPVPECFKARYHLRRRSDGDGFTLLKNEIPIYGGDLNHCLEAFCNDCDQYDKLTITKDVAVALIYKRSGLRG